jgi:hypothetical protein
MTLFSPGTVDGHSLSAKVFLSEGSVRVEAYYCDASPASHATVKVYAYRLGQSKSDTSLLLEGELDLEGKYTFVPRAAEDLYFVIDDNAGHRAEVPLLAEKLRSFFDKHQQAEHHSGRAVDPIGVSTGPQLLEGTPLWGKIVLGVGAIVGLAWLASWVARLRKARP